MIRLKNLLKEEVIVEKKRKKKEKMADLLGKFIIDDKTQFIKVKHKQIDLVLPKKSFKYLEKSLNSVIKTSTEQIGNDTFTLKDYDSKKKTININDEVVEIQMLRDMIKVATHI